MKPEDPISTAHQMHLKALLQLCRTHPVVRVQDLAEELGETPSTVLAALDRLQTLGLVEHEHCGGASLTSNGTTLAQCVLRRFEALKTVLMVVLGADEADAQSDAGLMQHAVTPETIHRIASFLEDLDVGHSLELDELKLIYEDNPVPCSHCEADG